MIVSEIVYDMVLLFCIEDYFNADIEAEIAIIVPDVLEGYKGSVNKIEITPDYLYMNFSSSPEHAPMEIARALMSFVSSRLINLHDELKGYETIFRHDFCVKSGEGMKTDEIMDFVVIAKSRL